MGCHSTKLKKHPTFIQNNHELDNEFTISWSKKKLTKSKTNIDPKQEKQSYRLDKNPIYQRRQQQYTLSVA
ncbi:unnamed protein product [Paramecium primaurelia]|uniref:Uncharacterized protein n=2 Tax=Paramecium TaxID=5884 RepID=A0A8S1WK96_9CILI|nr:unnamed protein product [Paramecium primaurelia]CAD8188569.1 unnamed protein product [Paramecium pentaurelia]